MPRVRPFMAACAVLSATAVPFAAAADVDAHPARGDAARRPERPDGVDRPGRRRAGPLRRPAPAGRRSGRWRAWWSTAASRPSSPTAAASGWRGPSRRRPTARGSGSSSPPPPTRSWPARAAGRRPCRRPRPAVARHCAARSGWAATTAPALRGGVRTIDLDRATLLPLRIRTQRAGARAEVVTLAPRALNRPAPGGRIPAGGPDRRRRPAPDDQGFRRTSPAAAARNLPYTPELPRRACRTGSRSRCPAGRRGRTPPAPRARSRPGGRCSRRCTPAAGSAWS